MPLYRRRLLQEHRAALTIASSPNVILRACEEMPILRLAGRRSASAPDIRTLSIFHFDANLNSLPASGEGWGGVFRAAADGPWRMKACPVFLHSL